MAIKTFAVQVTQSVFLMKKARKIQIRKVFTFHTADLGLTGKKLQARFDFTTGLMNMQTMHLTADLMKGICVNIQAES